MESLDPLSLANIISFMPLGDLWSLSAADPSYAQHLEARLDTAARHLRSLVNTLLADPKRVALMIKSSTDNDANVLYMLSAEKLARDENNQPVLRETKWLEHANFQASEVNGWLQACMVDDAGEPIGSPRKQVQHFIHREDLDTDRAVDRTLAFWRANPGCSVSMELAYVSKHYVKHRHPVPLLDGWSVNLDRYFYDYYDLKMMSYYYTESNDIKVMKETHEQSPLQDFESLCSAIFGASRE